MNAATSQVAGDAEECSSCDSGWTKYLSSPVRDVNGDDDEDDDRDKGHASGDLDEDDDDSMASDASTGLIQHKQHSKLNDASDFTEQAEDVEEEEEEEEKKTNCSFFSCKSFWKVEEGRNERKRSNPKAARKNKFNR